jgi:hypothetical protein
MLMIYSHRRSGTNFLNATIKMNFGVDIKTSHELPGARTDPSHDKIYILRDGRDVLTASYYYWINGGSPHFNIGGTINQYNISFGQFLRGETPLDRIDERCIHYNHVVDPVCNWINHTRWIYFMYTVRYEDLKNDLHNVMIEISKEFDFPLIYKEAKTITKLTGVKPRKGIIGDYKNAFDEKDLEYFWQKAGERMVELGYER